MLKSSGLVPIFIKRHYEMKHCSLKVKLPDTIGNVKGKISQIDHDYEVLIFNEMVLDESCALADFNIKNGSTLTLMRKSRVPMKIFIETLTGMTISFNVKPSDTIGKGMNFHEMVLDDRGSLLDFQIKNGFTLTLMRKSRRLLHIFFKISFIGKTFSFKVTPLDTIAKLKARLNVEEDMCVPLISKF
uniref:Ubiquitin-like domain-containing protein n=1 Tax=Tanacetum cinerariifolium TaxID=118510 RepID=A0A6L2MBF0_TANCI|nr:hypothetical protein [Tanacetum cinerariifolium]